MDPVIALAQHIRLVENKVVVDLPPAARDILLVDSYDQMFYEVRDANNGLVAGAQAMPQPPNTLAVDVPSFYETRFQGKEIRIAALLLRQANGSVTVKVGETLVKRDTLVWEILLAEIVPAALVAVTAAVLVWFGIARGLRPLDRLQEEIAARSQRDLRPVAEDEVPSEVRPVVHALNNLLLHLGDSLDAQRRFLANAAHQFRTPLAGLQTQVELILRQPLSEELPNRLGHVHRSAQRAARLANKLLALARAEPGAQSPNAMETIDLQTIVSEAAEEWVPRAIAKEIDLGFELSPCVARVEPGLTRELLDNLIDNAITYTPEGGTVTIRCRPASNAAMLEVEDNGIGIPLALREKVTERFFRVDPTMGQGCGLGLAIVKDIVTLHGAELSIDAPHRVRGRCCASFFRALPEELFGSASLEQSVSVPSDSNRTIASRFHRGCGPP